MAFNYRETKEDWQPLEVDGEFRIDGCSACPFHNGRQCALYMMTTGIRDPQTDNSFQFHDTGTTHYACPLIAMDGHQITIKLIADKTYVSIPQHTHGVMKQNEKNVIMLRKQRLADES